MNRTYIIFGFCLLLLGISLYLSFRQDTIIFDFLNIRTGFLHHPETGFFHYLIYSLPDGLWFASLLLIQIGISGNPFSWMMIVCALSPFILEVGQLTFLPGTFDWNDIITYLLTLIIVYLCIRRKFTLFKQ